MLFSIEGAGLEEASDDADERIDGENQIGELLRLFNHHIGVQADADKAADDDQIRVFDEGEHRQDGDEDAEKADRVVEKLVAGTNGLENGVGDEPCGDADDGRPDALFRSHAAEDR